MPDLLPHSRSGLCRTLIPHNDFAQLFTILRYRFSKCCSYLTVISKIGNALKFYKSIHMTVITKENPFKIVFVCLGNICRSPTAEGVFQHLVNERVLQSYFYVDSAGTSAYHIGEAANSKSRMTAREHGIELRSRARRFEQDDLNEFDLVVAMDRENLQNIKALDGQSSSSAKIVMMRDYDPKPGDGEVPDPYYGGMDGFEQVFQIVKRSCEKLLDELETHIETK